MLHRRRTPGATTSIFLLTRMVVVSWLTGCGGAAPPAASPTVASPGLRVIWLSSPPALRCPSPEAFEERLRLRLSDLDSRLPHPQRVRIEMGRSVGGVTGTLDLTGPITTTRALSGSSCDEVVTGLALIAALRLRELPVIPPSEKGMSEASQLNGTQSNGSTEPSVIGAIEVQGGYTSVPAPGPTGRARLELQWTDWAPVWWALSLAYARGSKAPFSTHGMLTQLDSCAELRGRAPRLRACGFVQAGGLHVQAETSSRGQSRPDWSSWTAIGSSLVIAVPVTRSWSLRTHTEASASLQQNEYFVAAIDGEGLPVGTDVASFTPPHFGWNASIGLAHEF